ncbi:MAG: hypothetical protein ACT4OL_12450, partial [Nitrospiraceae bacterium]
DDSLSAVFSFSILIQETAGDTFSSPLPAAFLKPYNPESVHHPTLSSCLSGSPRLSPSLNRA